MGFILNFIINLEIEIIIFNFCQTFHNNIINLIIKI